MDMLYMLYDYIIDGSLSVQYELISTKEEGACLANAAPRWMALEALEVRNVA